MKLIIGHPCSQDTPPVNTYELVTTSMSGDGDHDEENSQFGDYDTILKYAELLDAVLDLSWNARCEESNIWPVLATKAFELGLDQKRAEDWYREMVGRDVTCDDRYAMLTGYNLYWYDVNGKKFEVLIEPD